jgi:L-fuconolactonase
MIIDTHLHFWDLDTYETASRSWLERNPPIHRTFLPPDLKPHFAACGVDRGVIVEAARDSHALNRWWLSLAEQYEYIGAVVAGCTLEQDDLAAWFDDYSQSRSFVGVRTTPAGPSVQWWENPATQRGLQELVRRDLSLDLLVGYETYPAVAQMAAHYPGLRMILNHCAHPPIREDRLDEWRAALRPLAAYPNIHIKYSSLLLYSYPDSALERLRPVADFLLETFGIARMMWGSNWPVELLGGTYEQAFQTLQACVEPLTEGERAALFGGNAAVFYRVV